MNISANGHVIVIVCIYMGMYRFNAVSHFKCAERQSEAQFIYRTLTGIY